MSRLRFEGSFPFEELPEELQLTIVKVLDLPSLLSLTLASASCRHKFWENQNFNNWRFMDECARMGYMDLLSYAVSHGALVDERVVVEALEVGDGELAQWLFRLIGSSPSYANMNITFMMSSDVAARKGNRDYVVLTKSVPMPESAAEGGFVDLALELKGLHGFSSSYILSCYAAQGGHFEAMVRLLKTETSDETPGLALASAFAYGHFEIVKRLVDSGAALDAFCLQQLKPKVNFEIVNYLFDKFPSEFLSNLSLFADSCVAPTLALMEWLHGHEFVFTTGYVEKVLNAKLTEKNLLNCIVKTDAAAATDRFEAIQFLFETVGFRWTTRSILFAPCWASVNQMELLIQQSIGNKAIPPKALLYYVRAVDRADMKMVDLLLQKATPPPLLSDIVLECSFLENNMEVLRFIAESHPFPSNVMFKIFKRFEFFYRFRGDPSSFTGITTPMKSRIRYQNFLNLIKMLHFEYGANVDAFDLSYLWTVEHKYFSRSLDIMFKRKMSWPRTACLALKSFFNLIFITIFLAFIAVLILPPFRFAN